MSPVSGRSGSSTVLARRPSRRLRLNQFPIVSGPCRGPEDQQRAWGGTCGGDREQAGPVREDLVYEDYARSCLRRSPGYRRRRGGRAETPRRRRRGLRQAARRFGFRCASSSRSFRYRVRRPAVRPNSPPPLPWRRLPLRPPTIRPRSSGPDSLSLASVARHHPERLDCPRPLIIWTALIGSPPPVERRKGPIGHGPEVEVANEALQAQRGVNLPPPNGGASAPELMLKRGSPAARSPASLRFTKLEA